MMFPNVCIRVNVSVTFKSSVVDMIGGVVPVCSVFFHLCDKSALCDNITYISLEK